MQPLVTVIIPAYNAMPYLQECIESVLGQGFDAGQLELIVVDDGSEDQTPSYLATVVAEHGNVLAVRQRNSGRPGSARNVGLDKASGRYVFFLDADDYLHPGALRDIVDTAVAEGSDIVLAKMESSGGHKAPTSMFSRTNLDAELLESKAWETFGPWKLFDRSLIEENGLRFPDDMVIGEDQVFVATYYFLARKISILADRVYYHFRGRGDNTNVTSRVQSLAEKEKTVTRLVGIVVANTDPGRYRDGLMRRIFASTLASGLREPLLNSPREEIQRFARVMREKIGPYFTDTVRGFSPPIDQVKLSLLFANRVEALLQIARFEKQHKPLPLKLLGRQLALDLPPELVEGVPPDCLVLRNGPAIDHKAHSLAIEESRVTIRGSMAVRGLGTAPQEIVLILKNYQSGREIPVRTSPETTNRTNAAGALDFRCSFDLAKVLDGEGFGARWHVVLEADFGGYRARARFGRQRSAKVEAAVGLRSIRMRGLEVQLAARSADSGQLYFEVTNDMHPVTAADHSLRGRLTSRLGRYALKKTPA